MDSFIILSIIFLIAFFIYRLNCIYKTKYCNYIQNTEHFNHYLSISDITHDDHQDIIMNNSEENKMLSQRDSNLIPTYALYQPEVSGRHLNFFSHAPNTIPYFPNQIWSSTIQDPYYQPAYSNYFYNDGYFYPLF